MISWTDNCINLQSYKNMEAKMQKINFLKLAKEVVKVAENKKGENVILLDVQDKTPITNYFVIVTANSMPQINSITNEIEKTLKYDYEVKVLRRDGGSTVNWRVLDFGGLIVHVMSQDLRQLYNLENIWQIESKPEKKKTVKKTLTKKTQANKVMKTTKKLTKKLKK